VSRSFTVSREFGATFTNKAVETVNDTSIEELSLFAEFVLHGSTEQTSEFRLSPD
jgi:hypothetical protein